MLECYDQDDLLAYIEDALAPADAAALRKQLESDPPVAELVEAMRADRALLKAEPEPALPLDFAAQLEPMLVRPMLMDVFGEAAPSSQDPPGRERRRHRRQRRLRAARRMAIAAGVALVALGGVWAAFTNISFDRSGERVATMPRPSEQPFELPPHHAAAIQAWEEQSATVHHHLPSPAHRQAPSLLSRDGIHSSPGSSTPAVVAAEFALVIQSANLSAAEKMLTQLAGDLDQRMALVQNFSYEEAKSLEQAWLRTDNRDRRVRELTAGTNAASEKQFDQLADRVRDQYRTARPNAPVEMSRQLLGSRDVAASFAQQLEYSSRGATHTITVPLDRLQELLAGLAKEDGHVTWLQRLDEDAELGSLAAFADRAAVQEHLRQLRASGDDVLVQLPVVLVSMVPQAPVRR